MKFVFTWTLSGSTYIEANSLHEAQREFDNLSINDLQDYGSTDFTQEEILLGTDQSDGTTVHTNYDPFDYDAMWQTENSEAQP